MRLYTRDRVRRPRMRAWIRRIIQRMRRIRRTACRFRAAAASLVAACERLPATRDVLHELCGRMQLGDRGEVREIAQPAANARAALARAIRCTTVAARG